MNTLFDIKTSICWKQVQLTSLALVNHNHNLPIEDNPRTLRNNPSLLFLVLKGTWFLIFLYFPPR